MSVGLRHYTAAGLAAAIVLGAAAANHMKHSPGEATAVLLTAPLITSPVSEVRLPTATVPLTRATPSPDSEDTGTHVLDEIAVSTAVPDLTLVQLDIPAIQVDQAIQPIPYDNRLQTWDLTQLKEKIAWLGLTPHPEAHGNTVLAGHVIVRDIGEGPFFRLGTLRPGDLILLYSQTWEYSYRVEQVYVIRNDDSAVFENRQDTLTLLTCTNYNWASGEWEERQVVVAHLVTRRMIVSPWQETAQPQQN